MRVLGIYVVFLAILFMIFLAIALIPSSIAAKKGYSGTGFFFFGLFAFVPALIVSICLSDKDKQTEKENLDMMLKYKELYESGLMSKEEFMQKKRELLDED